MTTGIFNTGNFTQDHVKPSFASMLTRLMPNGTAPLYALTSMLGSETATAVEHGFFTKTMLFPEMTTTAISLAAATTMTVATTANILPGMLMRVNSTGENVLVEVINSPTEVQVSRSIGSVAAAATSANDALYQVGNAFEESSTRPTALNLLPVRITNLTQIFRNTWALSESARATLTIAGDTNIAESRQDCAAFHAADIEKAILFGQKSQGTRNGQPFRTMDGLISIVGNSSYYPPSYQGATNVFTATATTNWSQLEAMLDPIFNQVTDPKGGNERVMFVGGAAKLVLNNIGRLNATYQLVDGATNWGLQFSTLTMARGKLRLIEHPLLNSNANWAKMAIPVDLATFRVAYLGDRKTQSKEFNTSGSQAQDSGIDAVGGTLTTELTSVIKNPPANAVIYNLTSAAVG